MIAQHKFYPQMWGFSRHMILLYKLLYILLRAVTMWGVTVVDSMVDTVVSLWPSMRRIYENTSIVEV